MIHKDKYGHIIKMSRAYYFTNNGTSYFSLTPEQFLKWSHFCRNLGYKPTREDYNRFMKTVK